MGQLSENKPFETEIRFFISDIDQFRKRVDKLNGKLLREYSFTDYYYSAPAQKWSFDEKSLRIRVWRQPNLPTAVWFTKQETVVVDGFSFKRSLFSEGKIKLFEGDLTYCQTILNELGFAPSLVINKKHGRVWKVEDQGLEFCIEDVENFGWTGEFELDGTDIDKIKDAIERHKIALDLSDNQLSGKSLAAIFFEKSS